MSRNAQNGVLNKHCSAIYLAALAIVQLGIYAALTWCSGDFEFGSDEKQRPLTLVFSLLAATFVLHLVSLFLAIQLPDTRRLAWALIGAAILFRAVVLPSVPIQEVDIYRYIFDGAVANEGIDPYRYPPRQILSWVDMPDQESVGNVSRMADKVRANPGLNEVLKRVHYSELPTVYPPISQFVFRVSDWLTPRSADVGMRVGVMKGLIVLFDIGTMALLCWLLVRMRVHSGWCIAYGWSPLVIKEFANSGHLDSIAVFLAMAAIVLCVTQRTNSAMMASAALLGAAFGAKLFPIVLAPLLATFVWKRGSAKTAAFWCVCFIGIAAISIMPMVMARMDAPPDQVDGLQAFLTRWEINDLVFMVAEENLRPESAVAGQPSLWFVVTPNRFREWVVANTAPWFGDEERSPFLLTRTLLLGVFGAITLGLCWRTWRDPRLVFGSAFLTLAWFWFLAPTQNPWYWIWALPFVPFVRQRLWLLVSGLTLIYYARFWFQYHGGVPDSATYHGVAFFDFIIVWIEFVPFLLLLAFDGFYPLRILRRQEVSQDFSSTSVGGPDRE